MPPVATGLDDERRSKSAERQAAAELEEKVE